MRFTRWDTTDGAAIGIMLISDDDQIALQLNLWYWHVALVHRRRDVPDIDNEPIDLTE